MPEEVRDDIGYALDLAQHGKQADYAQRMHGDLRDVIEIRARNERGDSTFRGIYTAELGETVYVLHVFQKKSKSGIETPKRENIMSKRNAEIEIGTGNVFEQLGLPNPDERLRKARLMSVINDELKRRGFSQKDAAEATGLHQADISRIQHGHGVRYSTDRLLNVLARLGIDVEIVQRHTSAGKMVIEVRVLSHA